MDILRSDALDAERDADNAYRAGDLTLTESALSYLVRPPGRAGWDDEDPEALSNARRLIFLRREREAGRV